jgi:hypothetical protein
MIIKHIIRNVGMVPVSGIASTITIGNNFQFYQFRNKSERNCQFANNQVKCSWSNALAPKMVYKMMFAAAPKGLVLKEDRQVASKSKAAGSKAAGSKAAGSKAAGSKAAPAASKMPAASMVITDYTGWKATVTATGIDYPISAPLNIKPKVPVTRAM